MKKAKRSKSRAGRRGFQWVLLLLAAVVLAALLLVGRVFDGASRGEQARGDYRMRYAYDTIREFDGVKYRQRKDLTTILLMGVDKRDGEEADSSRKGGQADFLRLLVIDSTHRSVSQIQIDRDTMAPIMLLGPLGDELGLAEYQICMAHGFGDGREQSCRYEVEAVSRFLLDVPIDFYMALNLDGISVLNDSVGGVTVTLEDDFSHLDPAMTRGATLRLAGDQAEYYVRRRMDVSDGTNESRMRRQQDYIGKISGMLNQRISADKNFVGTLYDMLSDYLVTDLARGRLINEAWNARHYARSPLREISGTHIIGKNGYVEFYADGAALQDLIVELFYEPLK